MYFLAALHWQADLNLWIIREVSISTACINHASFYYRSSKGHLVTHTVSSARFLETPSPPAIPIHFAILMLLDALIPNSSVSFF